eukprot:767229-Amphidinium_carterae.1
MPLVSLFGEIMHCFVTQGPDVDASRQLGGKDDVVGAGGRTQHGETSCSRRHSTRRATGDSGENGETACPDWSHPHAGKLFQHLQNAGFLCIQE